MRIIDIRTIPLEVVLDETVFDANYTMKNKPALLVEVVTDEGLVGIGEAAHFGGPMNSTALPAQKVNSPTTCTSGACAVMTSTPIDSEMAAHPSAS